MSGRREPPAPRYDVVIPAAGRASLGDLLDALQRGEGPPPERLIVVDDRRANGAAIPLGAAGTLRDRLTVVRGRAAGPAAARNLGWHAAGAPWIAFLDDDVVPTPDWRARLAADLAAAGPEVGAVQGRIEVPLPRHRRPTDWERNVKGLEQALWATADMAYRRAVLAAAGGFDERFRRAYREDAELGLRVVRRGWSIVRGSRRIEHPVRRTDPLVSLRLQAGNADDVLMRALHGPSWRRAAGAPRGRRHRHLATTAVGLAAPVALAARRPRLAAAAGAAWATGTAELAWARIAPGPRAPAEVTLMALTSVAMPFAATAHTLLGLLRLPWLLGDQARKQRPATRAAGPEPPDAVLLDRDGTLVRDVPYNGDPDRVEPLPGARESLDRLRRAGVPLAVVSNQSGIGRGLLDRDRVAAVNRRVEDLLGPLGPWLVCPHAPDDGCECRKPAPGLVVRAAGELGVEPARCAVIGDIGADMEAARAVGARGVLVPNERTRPEEVAAAPEVAPDLPAAVSLLIGEAA